MKASADTVHEGGDLSDRHEGARRGQGRHSEAFPDWSTGGLSKAEYLANVYIAAALALGGAALFVHVIYRFLADLGDAPFVDQILQLLDGLLLVFILSELLHTVRAAVEEDVLITLVMARSPSRKRACFTALTSIARPAESIEATSAHVDIDDPAEPTASAAWSCWQRTGTVATSITEGARMIDLVKMPLRVDCAVPNVLSNLRQRLQPREFRG